jgi:hypothetical protein
MVTGLLAAQELPVKRVVLYKNGVGYFEHVGKINGNQNVTIPFTTGQLNDVLKSLTVLDLNGGRIGGITYDSAAPKDRQMADLRLGTGEKSTLTELLGGMRGAKLEVRSGTNVITGRLLSIERKTRISGGTTLEVDYLSLITDAGELRTTELSPAFSVKLLEQGLSGKVGQYLDLLSSAREPDVRRMVVATTGIGERSLFVSYVSEVPVWKTTYRIVLQAKPLLQGWAIVDNVVGQDWVGVQMSLVAGAPQSFIQKLSQPYYSRRPEVGLATGYMATPQTFESTLAIGGARVTGVVRDPSGAAVMNATVRALNENGEVAGEAASGANGTYELAALPQGAYQLVVEAAGFRSGSEPGVPAVVGQTTRRDVTLQVGGVAETVTVSANASSVQSSSAQVARSRTAGSGAAVGRGTALGRGQTGGIGGGSGGGFGGGSFGSGPGIAAQPRPLGDLFEYKLKEPITIRKNQSALVPIVQSEVEAEKVSVWNTSAGQQKPQRALWLKNSSGLTLDGGSFTVLEDGTFAGEGLMEPMRPDEKRLVSYATDLAVTASAKQEQSSQRVSRVKIADGVMVQFKDVREKKSYTFRNEDLTPRSVIVEHPVRQGFELRSDARPVETTAQWMRFRVPVASKQTATLVVEEARPVETKYTIGKIDPGTLDAFIKERSVDKPLEDALRTVIAQKHVVSELESQKAALDAEFQKIYDDQERLRENMKALKGSAEEKSLLQRYTKELDTQESRLDTLRKETAAMEQKVAAAEAELEKLIAALSFDRTL